MTPDWAALRRLRRAWAIAVGIWMAFLAFWQFAVPGDSASSAPFEFWLMAGALSILVPTSLVLAGGAARRLWRARRRFTALLPTALLCISVWAFPSLTSEAGLGPAISLWMVPCALFFSSVVSLLVVLYSVRPEAAPSDRGMDGWTRSM